MKSKKQEIIRASMLAFREHGFRNYTLDQLSKDIKVSKKTIYELFGSKKELIVKVIEYQEDYIADLANTIAAESQNAVEQWVRFKQAMDSEISFDKVAQTFEELGKYYASITQETRETVKSQVYNIAYYTIIRGQREEVFITELSAEEAASHYACYFSAISNDSIRPMDSTYQRGFDVMFYLFLRGILTDKGREIYKNLNTPF